MEKSEVGGITYTFKFLKNWKSFFGKKTLSIVLGFETRSFDCQSTYSNSLINIKFVFILIFTLCYICNYYFYFNNNLMEIGTNK